MSAVDLVVVEGFKHAPHPKIEVHRAANGKTWLHTDDPAVIGLVTDAPYAGALPCAALDDADAAAGLVARLARPLPEVLAALRRSA
jgi:molybdopterin-guanine dinucleotide biosynthesis protein B